jgi:hypothetical protein
METEAATSSSSSSSAQFSVCSLSSSPSLAVDRDNDTPTQSPQSDSSSDLSEHERLARPSSKLLPPAPGLLYTFPQKSAAWRALRTLIGAIPDDSSSSAVASANTAIIPRKNCSISGSNVAAWVGLSPYQDTSPMAMWARGVGIAEQRVVGNDDTDYGEKYEDRVRRITQAVLGCEIKEYGLFRSAEYPFLAVSLDGETQALRLSGVTDALPAYSDRFVVDEGPLIVEIKTSKRGLKPCPLVPHICQSMLQMYMRGRTAAFLPSWSADQIRIFFVEYSADFMRWMLMRCLLAHLHVEREVPILDDNRFFPWLIYPGGRHFPGATVSDYLSVQWFNWIGVEGAHPPTPRLTPLTYADWARELKSLGLDAVKGTPEVPCAHIPSWKDLLVVPGAPNDPALSYLPPRPRIWLVYNFARRRPMREIDALQPAEVQAQSEPAWFRAHFPHISVLADRLAQHDYDYGPRDEDGMPSMTLTNHYDGHGPENTHMRHLFVTATALNPSKDEQEPAATPIGLSERALFQQLVRIEEEKDRLKAEENERKGKRKEPMDAAEHYAEQDRKRRADEDAEKKRRQRQREGLRELTVWFKRVPDKTSDG